MKIIFFGTPEFAKEHLEALHRANVEIAAIVTKPDKPQGRSLKIEPTPVKSYAAQHLPNVPLFQPEKCSTKEFIETLKQYPADLFVVVAYGEIIKQEVIDLPRLGCINVHGSLLPSYRGAAPMQRALLNGEKETGITIIRLVLKMDAGDMLYKEAIPIPLEMTFPELENAMIKLGIKCLLKVIDDFKNNCVVAMPQDHSKATLAHKIETLECQIDWNKKAIEIHNLVRAVTPSPGAFTFVEVRGEKKRLKILKSQVLFDMHPQPKEVVHLSKDAVCIGTGEGALFLEQVQLEGSKAMAMRDFLRGIPELRVV